MPKIILNGTTYAAGLDQKTFDKIGTDTLDTDAQDLSGAVNELNTSKIDKAEFNTINTSIDISVSGTVNNNSIVARSNIANLSLQLSSLTGVTANDYIGTIPVKYRPPFESQIFVLANMNNAWSMIRGTISSDGRVKLHWGSQTVTALIICATYICNH